MKKAVERWAIGPSCCACGGWIPRAKLAWRFSLEDSVTGERREFANLGELLVFLLDEVSDRQYDD